MIVEMIYHNSVWKWILLIQIYWAKFYLLFAFNTMQQLDYVLNGQNPKVVTDAYVERNARLHAHGSLSRSPLTRNTAEIGTVSSFWIAFFLILLHISQRKKQKTKKYQYLRLPQQTVATFFSLKSNCYLPFLLLLDILSGP